VIRSLFRISEMAVFFAVSLLLVLLFFQERPPTPPSRAMEHKTFLRLNSTSSLDGAANGAHTVSASQPISSETEANAVIGVRVQPHSDAGVSYVDAAQVDDDRVDRPLIEATALHSGDLEDSAQRVPAQQSADTVDITVRTMAGGAAVASSDSAFAHVTEDVLACVRNKQFMILVLAFGTGVSIFNSFTTLIGQMIYPSGYSDSDAGLLGALIIAGGLVGAALTGPILDRYHDHNRVIKILFGIGLLCGVFFVSSLRPNAKPVLMTSVCVMGFFLLPILPLAFELGAECTFPVNEEVSSGFLMFGSTLTGAWMVILLDYLIPDKYHNIFTPSSICLISFMLVTFIVILFYNGPYQRRLYEKQSQSTAVSDSSTADAHLHATDAAIGNPLHYTAILDEDTS